MLLAIDIGNTQIVSGVYDQQTLKGHWRLASDPSRTGDEYGLLFLGLLGSGGIRPDAISGVILSSVVPALTPTVECMARSYFGRSPLLVSPELDMGLTIAYPHPHELGSDRLVNAAAAYARYRRAVIIVDFGTATTFCVVTDGGAYLGGVIAPGLGTAAESLHLRTAKLPRVELARPQTAIGRDTVSSIQSGLVFGYAGLVDELVRRIQSELPGPALVLATGGLARLIAQECRTIEEVVPLLTLEGLALIYRRNPEPGPSP